MYPNRMFKKGNYEYFQVSQEKQEQYLITKGDILTLEVFARDGFELIDILSKEQGGTNTTTSKYNYIVDQDGYVEFPIFGNMLVEGLTEQELKNIIEAKSAILYNEPYAILRVINRRAFIFKGSSASVISLNQGPTSLLEVIAKSGGLSRDLKAYSIKIIRGNLKNPEILEIDLSTIAGLQNAELIVQTNDIIYIEERMRVSKTAVAEIAPILSIMSSTAAIIVLAKNLKN